MACKLNNNDNTLHEQESDKRARSQHENNIMNIFILDKFISFSEILTFV